VAVAVAVGLVTGVAVAVGVGLALEGSQGVNAPTLMVYTVPPRAVSALLLPLAPEPADVNVLARSPDRIEPSPT
jgi:ABC-type proline/glycine betaine transport system permease subunit